MEQLNAKQLEEIKTLLASVGLEVRRLTPRRLVTRQAIGDSQAPAIGDSDARELRDRIKRVQGMAFKTGGIKSRLLRNMRDALANGYGFQRGATMISFPWIGTDKIACCPSNNPSEIEAYYANRVGVYLATLRKHGFQRYRLPTVPLLPAPRTDAPLYRGFPDGWNEVKCDAAAPMKRIVCT